MRRNWVSHFPFSCLRRRQSFMNQFGDASSAAKTPIQQVEGNTGSGTCFQPTGKS